MKFRIILILIVILIAFESMALFKPDFSFRNIGNSIKTNNTISNKVLADYAQQVFEKCSKESYTPSCYDKEIPKLMDYISMEDAFAVTKIIQEKDNKYLYCHVLGHNLSRRETEKDPSKWMDVITSCPSTMCNNGCLHGSMMDRYKDEYLSDSEIEELKPDMKIICEPRGTWNPLPIEQSMCYHAIGHLAMYITNADLNKASSLCEFVGKKEDGRDYVQTCTQGVFMQVFQPLEPEDFALVAKLTPKKEDVKKFCAPFKSSPIKFVACNIESWPLFRNELKSPPNIERFCSFSDIPFAYKTCQSGIMNLTTSDFMVDHDEILKLDNFCMEFSTNERRSECYTFTAGRLMQIDPIYVDKGLRVCQVAEKRGLAEECFRLMAVYGKRTYYKGSSEFKKYCDKMPGDWKNYCLTNDSKDQ